MPEDVEPPCALETGTKKSGRRKGTREGEQMRNNNQSSKEITARKCQKRA